MGTIILTLAKYSKGTLKNVSLLESYIQFAKIVNIKNMHTHLYTLQCIYSLRDYMIKVFSNFSKNPPKSYCINKGSTCFQKIKRKVKKKNGTSRKLYLK